MAVSSFIAQLLSAVDVSIVATAIKIAEILMEKLPDIFDIYFRREGVVFEIERLCALPEKPAPARPNNNPEIDPNAPLTKADIELWIKEHGKLLKEKYFLKSVVSNALPIFILRY